MKTLAERLRLSRTKKNWNQSQLARQAGIKPQVVQLLEAGKVLQSKHLFVIATALDVTAEWLLTGLPSNSVLRNKSTAGHLEEKAVPPNGYPDGNGNNKQVPIYSVTTGDNADSFRLDSDQVIGHVACHPRQHGMRGAFVIYCVGDAMSPRYENGDLIYCLPKQPLKPGQDILITLINDGQAMLKRLVKLDRPAQKLTYEQFNPPGKHHLNLREVAEIYAVVGRG
jgi:phage repressor protein C with HTH and peptisase S24 domain